LLAGDQITEGQYFSYPGRKFHHIATEFLDDNDGHPIVPGCVAWFTCETFDRMTMIDHELVFGRIVANGTGRLGEPPLLYSSRHGWRITGDKAREAGVSVRDVLLERVREAGFDDAGGDDGDDE